MGIYSTEQGSIREWGYVSLRREVLENGGTEDDPRG